MFSSFSSNRGRSESGGGAGMCYAFQRGECDRGSSCRFSHGDAFSAFGRGGAGRRSGTKSSEICYAFQNGTCDRGDLCRFTHEIGDIPEGRNEVKTCYAFAQGQCEYGAACKFSHVVSDTCIPATTSMKTDIDQSGNDPLPTDVNLSDPALMQE